MACSKEFCLECNIPLKEDKYHRHCPLLNEFGNKCNHICANYHPDERCCPESCYTDHVHCTVIRDGIICNALIGNHEHCNYVYRDGTICTAEKSDYQDYHSHCEECGNSLEEEDEGFCNHK